MNTLDTLKQEGQYDFPSPPFAYEDRDRFINAFADKAFRAGQLAMLDAVKEAMPPKTDRDVAPDGLSAMWDGGHNSYREEALAAITDLRENPNLMTV